MITYKTSLKTNSHLMAKVHLDSFPGFFLATLGYSFLNQFYACCIKSKEVISFCAFDEDNNLVGFAIASYQPSGFYKRLIKTNFGIFSVLAIKTFCRKPNAMVRLFINLSRRSDEGNISNSAALLSIAVLKKYQGSGVGKGLLSQIETSLRTKGLSGISLTTDAVNNERVLLFYNSMGYFEYDSLISYPNRKMLILFKQL